MNTIMCLFAGASAGALCYGVGVLMDILDELKEINRKLK